MPTTAILIGGYANGWRCVMGRRTANRQTITPEPPPDQPPITYRYDRTRSNGDRIYIAEDPQPRLRRSDSA
jgi:hypothetical protein